MFWGYSLLQKRWPMHIHVFALVPTLRIIHISRVLCHARAIFSINVRYRPHRDYVHIIDNFCSTSLTICLGAERPCTIVSANWSSFEEAARPWISEGNVGRDTFITQSMWYFSQRQFAVAMCQCMNMLQEIRLDLSDKEWNNIGNTKRLGEQIYGQIRQNEFFKSRYFPIHLLRGWVLFGNGNRAWVVWYITLI